MPTHMALCKEIYTYVSDSTTR